MRAIAGAEPYCSNPMTSSYDQDEMLALLDWFQALGIDAAVGETAHDWLARGDEAPGAGFAWPKRDVVGSERPATAPAAVRPSGAPSPPRPAARNAPSADMVRPRAATPLGAS
ncbi:MAG TPA: hypothetical protein PKE16_08490, partial [Hyphomicrobium sp.]|nr:hypothetical protein [Hyphomicrobium sp.]